jgi:hypothetical protein
MHPEFAEHVFSLVAAEHVFCTSSTSQKSVF